MRFLSIIIVVIDQIFLEKKQIFSPLDPVNRSQYLLICLSTVTPRAHEKQHNLIGAIFSLSFAYSNMLVSIQICSRQVVENHLCILNVLRKSDWWRSAAIIDYSESFCKEWSELRFCLFFWWKIIHVAAWWNYIVSKMANFSLSEAQFVLVQFILGKAMNITPSIHCILTTVARLNLNVIPRKRFCYNYWKKNKCSIQNRPKKIKHRSQFKEGGKRKSRNNNAKDMNLSAFYIKKHSSSLSNDEQFSAACVTVPTSFASFFCSYYYCFYVLAFVEKHRNVCKWEVPNRFNSKNVLDTGTSINPQPISLKRFQILWIVSVYVCYVLYAFNLYMGEKTRFQKFGLQ